MAGRYLLLCVGRESTAFARHLSLLIFKVEGDVPSWADSHWLWGITSSELKGARWTKGTVAWGMVAWLPESQVAVV